MEHFNGMVEWIYEPRITWSFFAKPQSLANQSVSIADALFFSAAHVSFETAFHHQPFVQLRSPRSPRSPSENKPRHRTRLHIHPLSKMGIWDAIQDLVEAATPWSTAEADAPAEDKVRFLPNLGCPTTSALHLHCLHCLHCLRFSCAAIKQSY